MYIIIFALVLHSQGFKIIIIIITALHGMQMRSCDEISVRPSVRLSNVCIVTKRKKNLFKFLYLAKDHSV